MIYEKLIGALKTKLAFYPDRFPKITITEPRVLPTQAPSIVLEWKSDKKDEAQRLGRFLVETVQSAVPQEVRVRPEFFKDPNSNVYTLEISGLGSAETLHANSIFDDKESAFLRLAELIPPSMRNQGEWHYYDITHLTDTEPYTWQLRLAAMFGGGGFLVQRLNMFIAQHLDLSGVKRPKEQGGLLLSIPLNHTNLNIINGKPRKEWDALLAGLASEAEAGIAAGSDFFGTIGGLARLPKARGREASRVKVMAAEVDETGEAGYVIAFGSPRRYFDQLLLEGGEASRPTLPAAASVQSPTRFSGRLADAKATQGHTCATPAMNGLAVSTPDARRGGVRRSRGEDITSAQQDVTAPMAKSRRGADGASGAAPADGVVKVNDAAKVAAQRKVLEQRQAQAAAAAAAAASEASSATKTDGPCHMQ